MSKLPKHPGKILFYGDDKLISEDTIDQPDEELHFARDASGELVPVVKIVRTSLGPKMAEIQEYGPSNQLLRSTRMVAD